MNPGTGALGLLLAMDAAPVHLTTGTCPLWFYSGKLLHAHSTFTTAAHAYWSRLPHMWTEI